MDKAAWALAGKKPSNGVIHKPIGLWPDKPRRNYFLISAVLVCIKIRLTDLGKKTENACSLRDAEAFVARKMRKLGLDAKRSAKIGRAKFRLEKARHRLPSYDEEYF